MYPIIGVVRPSGIFDSTQATQFHRQVRSAIADGAEIVLVDLQDVTLIDSSGLTGLAIAFKTVKTVGRRLSICSMNDQVKIIFELTGLDRVCDIFADQNAFKAGLNYPVRSNKSTSHSNSPHTVCR